MNGILTDDQIDQVLQMELTGRLGFISGGKPFVIPVSYAFDGKSIYCHSRAGFKIREMRKNSDICFEVDKIDNLDYWRSVLVHGQYEELTAVKEIQKAIRLLSDRLDPILVTDVVKNSSSDKAPQIVEKKLQPVYYRINITSRTGRYQKPYIR